MAKLRRIADFLGLKQSIVALLGMVILVGMGERMAERFLPIYLMALGGGELAIGLLGGLQNLLGALYSFRVATWLIDSESRGRCLFSICWPWSGMSSSS